MDRVDWHTGRTVDDASNSSATTTARLALKWAATDTLSIAPSVYYQKRDVDDTAAWWSPRPGNPDPTNGQFDNPLRNGNAVAQPSTDQFLLPALKVGWNLGSMQLISNTSYFKRDQSATTDYTQYDRAIFLGNPYPRAGAQGLGFWGDHQRNWTQELRLQSTDAGARVAWTAGLFYQRAKETTSQQVFDPDLLDDLGMSPDYGDGFIYVEDPRVGVDRQIAVFGQADVRFAERFTFTLGVRYAHARFEGSTFYPETLVVGPEVSSTGTQTERPVTPKFGLKYELSADSLVYATAAKGFRIGGTNAKVGQFCYGGLDSALGQVGLSDVPPTYNSDSLWSYELGMKNSLAQNRLVLNASAYYVKWRDIQQNVPLTACGFQYTGNLGEASSKGFDLQASLKVNHALSLGGAFSYTDAQFTKTVELASSVQSIVQKGDHLGGAPWTLAAFGELDLPLEGVETYVRADYQYSANQNDVVPNQNPLNGGYALWFPSVTSQSFASLRAGVKHRGIDVSVFAQNLFDTQPRLSEAQDIGAANGGTPLFYVISWRPRTVGVTATYHY
ncbi:MAG: TonB-dependent receptor [Gammaproteobacteria bacterium]